MTSIDDIQSALTDIAPEFGVLRAYLFGSYARGDQTRESDIDLLVVLEAPLGFKRARFYEELEQRLGLPVDIIFGESQLYEPARESFNRDKVMIYAA